MVKCDLCKDNVKGIFYHFKNSNGERITVCDSCYQELAIIKKENGKTIEYIIYNNNNYFLDEDIYIVKVNEDGNILEYEYGNINHALNHFSDEKHAELIVYDIITKQESIINSK